MVAVKNPKMNPFVNEGFLLPELGGFRSAWQCGQRTAVLFIISLQKGQVPALRAFSEISDISFL